MAIHMTDSSAKSHLQRQPVDTWVGVVAFLIVGAIFAGMVWLSI